MNIRRMYFFLLMLLVLNCRLQFKEPHLMLRDYAVNNARDFADIVNLGVEDEVYGFSLYLLIGPLGFQDSVDRKGYGLMNGSFGSYRIGDSGNPVYNYISREGEKETKEQFYFGELNSFGLETYYFRTDNIISQKRGKNSFLYAARSWCYRCRHSFVYQEEGLKKIQIYKRGTMYVGNKMPPAALSISLGLKYGIRFGINV